MRVSPFRDPRLVGHLHLPEAYRSLSRLSSAPSAKASALRPFCLTVHPSSRSVGETESIFDIKLSDLLLDVFSYLDLRPLT